MMVAACFLAVAGLGGYALMSMRTAMDQRFTAIEEDYAKADERVTVLTSELDVVTKKMGVTEQELAEAQEMAKQLKDENARVRRALSAKADSKAVAKLQ